MENNYKYNSVMRFVNGKYKEFNSLEKYEGSEKIINIPDEYDGLTVYEIGYDCFDKNELIEKVNLPSTICIIDSGAFSFSKNLRTINLDNIEYIETSAFAYSGVENVTLNNVSEIGMSAFSNCNNLKEVVINGDIKNIKSSSFANCTSLKKIILPETIEKIEDNAFSGCKVIEEIYVPSSAKISKYAFEKNAVELIKKSKGKTKNNDVEYNLDYLLSETKKMTKEEIEKYIKDLLVNHKLDSFDSSDITNMNDIFFNKNTGEISWKCNKHGACSCNLWDLLENKGKMITKLDRSGCGYC